MSTLPPLVVIATNNAGKVVEFRRLFARAECEIRGLTDYAPFEPAIEDASTFEGNAEKKALHAAKTLGLPCLADDSGLLVDALDGAPGIYSARYAGDNASDDDNVEKLLKALAGVEERSARFVCSLVLVSPTGEVLRRAHGRVEGEITQGRTGEGGFGYDPVFRPVGEERTMAELPTDTKNQLSHRAEACRAFLDGD